MLPFTRKTLATGTSALLILGGALLVPAAAIAAEPSSTMQAPDAVSVVDTTVTPDATDAAAAAVAPTAEPTATAAPTNAPVPAETAAPVIPSPAAPATPAPAPSVAPSQAPTPAAVPNPSGIRITVSHPTAVGEEYQTSGARPKTTILGYAAPGSAITVTDKAGAVLGTGNADGGNGLWTVDIVYPDDAPKTQTVVITAVRFGVVDDVLEHTFRLMPLRMEAPSITTPPAGGATVRGPGQNVPVTFSGTGVAGSILSVFQLPWADVRLADLDGDQNPIEIGSTTVAADGTWTFTATVPVGTYSISAFQGQYDENPDPESPFRAASDPIEYRNLTVVSTDGAATELPETGSSSPALGALAFLTMGAGALGMLVARRRVTATPSSNSSAF